MFLLIIAGVVGAIGVLCLVPGLRGRRINDHPICRRCGFDLVGVDKGVICPECGANLERPRSIRIGARRRRPGLITCGAALSVIAISGGTIGVLIVSNGIDPTSWKPTWMLMMETSAASHQTRRRALNELADRIQAGELKTRTIDTLVARSLAVQADPDTPWMPAWGSVFEEAWDAQHVSNEQMLQYAENGLDVSMVLADRVRDGVQTRVAFRVAANRIGGRGGFFLNPQFSAIRIDGAVTQEDRNGGFLALTNGAIGETFSSLLIPGGIGQHEVELDVALRITDRTSKPTGVELPSQHTGSIAVVDPEVPLVRIIEDETMRAAFESSIADSLSITGRVSTGGSVNLNVQITDRVPMTYAAKLFLRDSTGKENRGNRVILKGRGILSQFGNSLDGFQDATVDLIFRPSAEVAEVVGGIEEIWGGEMIFEDIPIVWIGPEPASTNDTEDGG